MFDAESLTEGQRSTLCVALFARKRSLQARATIGLAALIMWVIYWFLPTFTDVDSSFEKLSLVLEWLLLAGAVLSVVSVAVWLWIEHRAKQDLLRIGVPKKLIKKLWAIKKSELDKVIRG